MLREYVQIIFGSLQAGSPRRKLSLKLPEAYMIWITEHDVVSNVIFFGFQRASLNLSTIFP